MKKFATVMALSFFVMQLKNCYQNIAGFTVSNTEISVQLAVDIHSVVLIFEWYKYIWVQSNMALTMITVHVKNLKPNIIMERTNQKLHVVYITVLTDGEHPLHVVMFGYSKQW